MHFVFLLDHHVDWIFFTVTHLMHLTVCSAFFDLLIIVDSSSSVGQANFVIMQDFILRLVDTFEIGVSQVQASSYSINLCRSERRC